MGVPEGAEGVASGDAEEHAQCEADGMLAACTEPCDGGAEDVADYVAAGWSCERAETSSEASEYWNTNGSE